MPNHQNLLGVLLIAALPACFIPTEHTYTEKNCLPADEAQRQCRGADDVPSNAFSSINDDEVLDIGDPMREEQHSFRCTYAVSIRGINCAQRMPVCSGGTCTGSVACGPPGTILPIEHTTMTLSVTSDICPASDAVAPSLQAMRDDITLVSVDAPGTLETATVAQCCYLVTYGSNAYD